MPKFKLEDIFTPAADQPKAIREISAAVTRGDRFTTLLGATGTGKTMTMAGVIQELQRPTLVLAHNKTLAAQLCNEFRTFFPDNAVEYFVSYYDYYQPEAYVPSRDLYIEKDSAINEEVDRLRHAATAALFARRDVIIVASVSAIFGLGSPETYEMNMQVLRKGDVIDRDALLRKLVSIQYKRNDTALGRGTFRVRGETLEVFPAYEETAFRATLFGDEVERLQHFDPLTGELHRRRPRARRRLAGDALQRQGGQDRPRGAGDRARAQQPLPAARVRGQAAGVAPPAAAHAVRHGDAARDGLLQRHRELLADPRRPRAGRPPVLPDRLLPRGLRLLPRRVAPDRAADRRHVRGRPLPQADARRLRLPAAVGARQPPAEVRRVPHDHADAGVRLAPRPASTRRPTPARSSSRSCARRGSSTRWSRCARRATRSTTS